MNDSELITAVRESFTGVQSDTGVEQIVSRSRAMRARRRVPVLAAALAVAAGAAVGVTALPAQHQAGRPPGAQLAAWTVVKQADGAVSVTLRQLRDPGGLQRRLRADGVPASVTFSGHVPRPCRRYPVNGGLINRVFSGRTEGGFPVMIIHVTALPDGTGVQINPPAQQPVRNVEIGLVYASPSCTGG